MERWIWPGICLRFPFRKPPFSLEEKGEKRTGLYFVHEGVPAGVALRARCRWSDLLVGMKNVLETGEAGFTEPYREQVTGP